MTPFVHIHKIPRTSLPTIVDTLSALLSYLHTQMRLSASKTSLWRLEGELISTSHSDDDVGKFCTDACFMSYRVGRASKPLTFLFIRNWPR